MKKQRIFWGIAGVFWVFASLVLFAGLFLLFSGIGNAEFYKASGYPDKGAAFQWLYDNQDLVVLEKDVKITPYKNYDYVSVFFTEKPEVIPEHISGEYKYFKPEGSTAKFVQGCCFCGSFLLFIIALCFTGGKW